MAVALLLVMLTAAALSVARVAAAERACARRRLVASLHGVRAGAVGRIGVSLLLTGPITLRRIEELLAVEYALYEVVAVLDGTRHEELFAALVARYRLIRVEYHPTGELPVRGIRALYRSRTRCFRRLVLVDFAADEASDGVSFPACDAAAEVASYDYLLPLRPGERLTDGAIERIAVGVAAVQPSPAVLRARSGGRTTLYSRAAVVAAGGFRRGLRRRAKPRRTIFDPLTVPLRSRAARRRRRMAGTAALLAALAAGTVLTVGAAAVPTTAGAVAWSITLALVVCCRIRVGQLRRRCGQGPEV